MLVSSWNHYTRSSRSVRRLLFAGDEFPFLRNYETLIVTVIVIVILPNSLTDQEVDSGRVKCSMVSGSNMLASFVKSKSGMFV
jgi:hypothetical protein